MQALAEWSRKIKFLINWVQLHIQPFDKCNSGSDVFRSLEGKTLLCVRV
jgi:hypothetical protein